MVYDWVIGYTPVECLCLNFYSFRMHQSRVYYMPLSLANLATRSAYVLVRIDVLLTMHSIARPNLLSVGTCLGKVGSPRLVFPSCTAYSV